jgi:hypothetical protein
MNINTVRTTLIAIVVSIIILFISSTSVAAASIETTTENCGYDSYQREATIPLSCLTFDDSLSHCILTNPVKIEAQHASRHIPTKIIYLAWLKTEVTTETLLNPKNLLRWIPAQELPPHYYPEYHCRNCLNSEKPPQI